MNSIAESIPEAPDASGAHMLHYVLDTIEMVEVGLAIAGVELGAFGLGIEIAGTVAGEAALLGALGIAHADAINEISRDQIHSGFSRGVVLGADGRSVSFTKSHFFMFSPMHNDVYPELGHKFQHAYNRALVAGYVQGKRLTKNQSGVFFGDLISRMSVHPSVNYGPDSALWNDKTWADYYLEAAAIFRRDHLK